MQKLYAKIAYKFEIPKPKAKAYVDAILDEIKDVVVEEGSIRLHGFGTFKKQHVVRSGEVNGKPWSVDKNVVKFKAAKSFNEDVNR